MKVDPLVVILVGALLLVVANAAEARERDHYKLKTYELCSDNLVCYALDKNAGIWCTEQNETVRRHCG